MRTKNRSLIKPIAGTIKPSIKTGVTLSEQAHSLLRMACLDRGRDQSQMVESLILEHLAGYYIARRNAGEGGENKAAG